MCKIHIHNVLTTIIYSFLKHLGVKNALLPIAIVLFSFNIALLILQLFILS